MPNWIPILLVLLTQGAGGAINANQTHEMMRMLRCVVQHEELSQSNKVVTVPQKLEFKVPNNIKNTCAKQIGSQVQQKALSTLSSANGTRDGPLS